IYSDARNHYASDFHDVTKGNNGAFRAGPNWDHPTGWGSVDARNLIANITIPDTRGTIKGTVTDAATGLPVAGAKISVGSFNAESGADGTYSLLFPVGDATVTVRAYGYQETSSSIHVADGETTTQDFTLDMAKKASLHGRVIDG